MCIVVTESLSSVTMANKGGKALQTVNYSCWSAPEWRALPSCTGVTANYTLTDTNWLRLYWAATVSYCVNVKPSAQITPFIPSLSSDKLHSLSLSYYPHKQVQTHTLTLNPSWKNTDAHTHTSGTSWSTGMSALDEVIYNHNPFSKISHSVSPYLSLSKATDTWYLGSLLGTRHRLTSHDFSPWLDKQSQINPFSVWNVSLEVG